MAALVAVEVLPVSVAAGLLYKEILAVTVLEAILMTLVAVVGVQGQQVLTQQFLPLVLLVVLV
jgi:hypothetical protein